MLLWRLHRKKQMLIASLAATLSVRKRQMKFNAHRLYVLLENLV